MEASTVQDFINDVLKNMPSSWLNLTTHRLDVYDEKLAKTQFLEQFETLFKSNNSDSLALYELPTSYDYIRLGHPLSCILEWAIANMNELKPENAISFSSKTTPILAVLRKNLLDNKNTQIIYTGKAPSFFDAELVKRVYGYKFELKHIESIEDLSSYGGSTLLISELDEFSYTGFTYR